MTWSSQCHCHSISLSQLKTNLFLESQHFIQSLTPKIFKCSETDMGVSLIGKVDPYVTCRSAEGLSQVCHRSVQSYSRPIWRKTEVCKSAYCLWQTSHENDFFFDCVLPFILFAASLLQTFRDFWWLCNKDLLLCLHLICSRRCADNHPHETCGAVQHHKIASK